MPLVEGDYPNPVRPEDLDDEAWGGLSWSVPSRGAELR